MAKKLSDDELKAVIDDEMRQAVGFWSGKLAQQRQKAMVYYLGLAENDLAPPDIEGRSSVVSTDVRNTIESMLPQLMVKFSGSETIVEFMPRKPGDEQKAEQATDYINYVYHVQNHGERVTYAWLKDALLSKNGFVKVWWDTRSEETSEEYIGLTDVELAQIEDDDELEITEQLSYDDEDDIEHRDKLFKMFQDGLKQVKGMPAKPVPQQPGQPPQPPGPTPEQLVQAQIDNLKKTPVKQLFDVTCKRTKKGGKICVENIPPEEFLISRKAKTIADSPFVGHRVARTLSELKSMGYKDLENISGEDQATALNMERIERLAFDDELAYVQLDSTGTADESQRIVWVTEAYVRCDADGDGIAELRKVVYAGGRILDNEVVDIAPFVSITPIPMPHKFFGLSIADLGMASQKINTSLLRAGLDNNAIQVNGRFFAVDGQVNLDDLLASRPGGVVRIKSQGAVGRLEQGMGDGQGNMAMIEYMKGFHEDATGWSRNSQGNDPSSLANPLTATQANIVTNKADMRMDLIARNFAEGFREMFRMMLKLVSQYQTREDVIRLRGSWVPINPREWRNGFDLEINVGLGTGNKDQQVGHMTALLAQQAQIGMAAGTVTPQNVYQAQKELVKALGYRNADKFFTDPKDKPIQQPPDPNAGKAQAAMQLKQMELQHDGEKFQADMQLKMSAQQQAHESRMMEIKAQYDLQASNDQRDAQREQMKAQYEMQVAQAEQASKRESDALKAEMDKYKADLDSQTKLAIAQLGAVPPVDVAPMQQMLQAMIDHLNAPIKIIRDPTSGRTLGVQRGNKTQALTRDQQGRADSLQ